MTLYKVNEMFETIQGEGVFTGVPAVFVRLQICPVGCSWCQADAAAIVEQYQRQGYSAKHIVITGGEPCLYDLTELTQAFEAIGCQCQIETSGTFEVKASANTWVTVSPKVAMKG